MRIIFFSFCFTNFFGSRVAASQDFFQMSYSYPTLFVDVHEWLRYRREAAPFQRGVESGGVVPDPFDVVHEPISRHGRACPKAVRLDFCCARRTALILMVSRVLRLNWT
jgi:hypothetical protein